MARDSSGLGKLSGSQQTFHTTKQLRNYNSSLQTLILVNKPNFKGPGAQKRRFECSAFRFRVR